MSAVSAADTSPQAADNRRRLAEAVKARRLEKGLSVRAAAAQTGVARDTWIGLEEATRRTAETNYAGIEDTLQWGRGSIQLILDGGEPMPALTRQDAAPNTFLNHDASHPADVALIRIMRNPDLTDEQRARIIRTVITDQQRYAEQRAAELIEQELNQQ